MHLLSPLLLVLLQNFSCSAFIHSALQARTSRIPKQHPQQIVTTILRQSHIPADDDDVSQHEVMTYDDINAIQNITTSKSKYRPIEDWHEETSSPAGLFALESLKREKLRWSKKFEDLGGDGI